MKKTFRILIFLGLAAMTSLAKAECGLNEVVYLGSATCAFGSRVECEYSAAAEAAEKCKYDFYKGLVIQCRLDRRGTVAPFLYNSSAVYCGKLKTSP